jgi:hypothetical protein
LERSIFTVSFRPAWQRSRATGFRSVRSILSKSMASLPPGFLPARTIPHVPKASAICPGGTMKASVPLGVTCPFQAAGTVRGSAVQASSRR